MLLHNDPDNVDKQTLFLFLSRLIPDLFFFLSLSVDSHSVVLPLLY